MAMSLQMRASGIYLGLLAGWGINGAIAAQLPGNITNPRESYIQIDNSPKPNVNLVQSASLLVSQQVEATSQSLYKQGRYSDALIALQDEMQDLNRQSIERAAALGNLALLQQHVGNPQAANASLAEGLTLAQSLDSKGHVVADLLNLRGQLEIATGKSQQALVSWEQAEVYYRALGKTNQANRSQISQAQALQRLGFYRRALDELTALSDRLQNQPAGPEKVMQLQALGEAMQLVGDGQQAEPLLQDALAMAQGLGLPKQAGSIALSLGNGTAAQGQTSKALEAYKQAAEVGGHVALLAQINQLGLLADNDDAVRETLIPSIQQGLQSDGTLDAQLKFGHILTQLPSQSTLAQQVLSQAFREAELAQDPRSQSYALGYLGALYQQQGQETDALRLTREALKLAQTINAPEITYQWQRQLGQLLKQEGDVTGAIAAYDGAIADLEILRGDLTAVNRDLQFSFREGVEPIYRESVALLLNAEAENPQNLDKARQRIEALQLAELDNFFREACLDAQSVAIDQVVDQDNPTAAVIYPILLDDRMEVIVKIPQQPLQRYRVAKSVSEVARLSTELQESLLEPDETLEVKELSQTLNQWLVEPLEKAIAASGSTDVDTLVFVLDGPLRSIPMGVLYDGEQYLVEKYAIALSLGLQLLDPRPLAPQDLGILAAGLAETPAGFGQFPPLPEVPGELALIDTTVGQTKQLLNQDFTQPQLAASVQDSPFNVLHLATHGQFSSRAEDTFVLAADGPINVNQFDDLLRQRETAQETPIELLVLSACQTALGDDRATLGLAGVAVRAGARSTLASLWNIGDQSTSILIGEFYRELAKGDVTKAEALRRAQVVLLRDYPNYARPTYWAPYVMVGNWL